MPETTSYVRNAHISEHPKNLKGFFDKRIDFGVLEPDSSKRRKEPGDIRFMQLLRKISKRKKGRLFTRQSLRNILLMNGLSTEEMVEKHLSEVLELIVAIPSFFTYSYTLIPVRGDNEHKYKIARYADAYELFWDKTT